MKTAIAELIVAAEALKTTVNRSDTSSGKCRCGDDMRIHPAPQFCNHDAVDSGRYAAKLAVDQADKAITAAKEALNQDSLDHVDEPDNYNRASYPRPRG